VKIDSKEKDMLISQLKAHIFELEQHEKDYDNLNQKFRNLQNECSLLNQEKLRLEYEIKQRSESQNKQNLDLRTELENIQLDFNEKLVINKKLYNENGNLSKNVELKNLEINDLNQRLEDYAEQVRRLSDEKLNLERIVNNLNDLKNSQVAEISKLVDDNQKFTRICKENDKALKNLEAERLKLLSKQDELNFQLKNLNGKLQSREENLSHTNRQWEESKNANAKLQQTLRDFEKKMEMQRNEIASLNNQLAKERNERSEAQKEIENAKVMLNERDKNINRYANELENCKNLNGRLTDDKRNLILENERIENNVVLLNRQNDDVRIEF
jgi:chromosome segregation ATPase